MSDQTTADYVAVDLASNMTGIPARTLRYWIGTGKLAAVAGKRGKLVSVGDVHRLAGMAGRTAGNHNGHAGNGVASAGNGAGNHADPPDLADIGEPPTALMRDGTRAQLALIRDEWLAPLLAPLQAANSELSRQVGRLEAERDQARREADELRARLESPATSHAASAAKSDSRETDIDTTMQASPRPWWRFW